MFDDNSDSSHLPVLLGISEPYNNFITTKIANIKKKKNINEKAKPEITTQLNTFLSEQLAGSDPKEILEYLTAGGIDGSISDKPTHNFWISDDIGYGWYKLFIDTVENRIVKKCNKIQKLFQDATANDELLNELGLEKSSKLEINVYCLMLHQIYVEKTNSYGLHLTTIVDIPKTADNTKILFAYYLNNRRLPDNLGAGCTDEELELELELEKDEEEEEKEEKDIENTDPSNIIITTDVLSDMVQNEIDIIAGDLFDKSTTICKECGQTYDQFKKDADKNLKNAADINPTKEDVSINKKAYRKKYWLSDNQTCINCKIINNKLNKI